MSNRAEDLEPYRHYLRLLAHLQLSPRMRRILDPSDMAQLTLIRTHENREKFRGRTSSELKAWLRAILAQQLALAARNSRSRSAEVLSLAASIEQSSYRIENLVASRQPSPSEYMMQVERAVLITRALLELPEDQRTAVELRYLRGLSVPDVAIKMSRSTVSVTGLLYRGTRALRQRMVKTE
jgi:RNA polymerase sigma-70 factor, ECF subfamily